MTNLDYEQRMSALNQLIHETLGVSLNTVRAAYGRARNASITIKSSASETGRMPVSSARPISISELVGDRPGAAVATEARLYKPVIDAPLAHYPIVDRMPRSEGRSFLSRFKKAIEEADDEDWQTHRSDTLPMLVFSKPGLDSGAGEHASDWHRLRNEFWSIAQADATVMERYKRDVLG
jgi:hypothetical protein